MCVCVCVLSLSLTTALCSTRALTWSTLPETTRGKMEESAPLQNRYSSPAHKRIKINKYKLKCVKRTNNINLHTVSCGFFLPVLALTMTLILRRTESKVKTSRSSNLRIRKDEYHTRVKE